MAKSLLTKILFFTFLFFFVFSPHFSWAQSSDIGSSSVANSAFFQKQDAIKNNTGLESWTNEAMSSNMMSLFIGLNGTIPAEIFDLGSSQTSFYIPGGAVGNLNNLIASLHTPPASGIEYIAQMKDNFLGKPAYAQGVGFRGLQFLIPLWRGFRNMVYVLATLIFLVIGLMIILRVKINPQTVITIQSAIPQVFTTLILVTFSYAIAGLVIDFCNLLQAIFVALMFSVKGVKLTDNLFGFHWGTGLPILSDLGNLIAAGIQLISKPFNFRGLSNMNLDTFQAVTFMAAPGWLSTLMLGGLLGAIVTGFLSGGLGNAVFGESGRWVFDKIGALIGGGVGGLIGAVLVPLILSILVAFWLIKLYFGLLKSYVTLLFKIVLAPLEIALGAFPNSKVGFSTWFMDVLANMAVFPIVTIYIILLNLIVIAVSGVNSGSGGGIFHTPVWSPSLISNNSISPSILSAAVGLAGLALLAKLPGLIPEHIFKIAPSPYGTAIGESLSKNIFAGMGKSIADSAGKRFGDTVVNTATATGQATLQRFGIGDRAPVNPENSGANITDPRGSPNPRLRNRNNN